MRLSFRTGVCGKCMLLRVAGSWHAARGAATPFAVAFPFCRHPRGLLYAFLQFRRRGARLLGVAAASPEQAKSDLVIFR